MFDRISRITAPITASLDAVAPGLIPLLARLTFAAVLFRYFWVSAMTKFDGLSLSDNAYIQILPKAMEKAGYDTSQFSIIEHTIVAFGSISEMVLPILVVVGLLTRPAALAMIGFVIVQSLTDLWGHNLDAQTFGAWFDKNSGSLVIDQRSLWVMLLATLVMMGGGWLSVDRAIYGKRA